MKVRQPWKEYDHSALEDKLNTFWARTQVYKRVKAAKSEGDNFYLVDGPPFTTSGVEMGHFYNKTVKDAVIRYYRLQGMNVRDQPGFDMHGLPIEVKVEGSLGIKNKNQVEELGVETFITSCKDFAFDFQQKMAEEFRSFGFWMDWENPFLTVNNTYIESAWWSLKKMHSKELLIKTDNILAWCPRCETALADSEIERDSVESTTVYLKLPIKGRRDEYLVVCTTQFWTLIGNMAVAVHPTFDYARLTVRLQGRKETLIVLEEKVEELAEVVGIEAYEITETVKGKELEGLEYFHPMMGDVPFQKQAEGEWVHKVITSNYVRPQYTGCVHIAPGHGIEDFNIGTRYKLPVFSPLDERGVISTTAGMKFAGKTVDEAEEKIISDLKSMRFILHESRGLNKTGHCWRCQTPIIYRATEQWCLRVGDIRDKLVKASKRTKWTPDWVGSQRFADWLKGSRDWCISRQRFWGIPMPVWECITDVCSHVEVIGSVKDLQGASGFKQDMDLHRPWIDKVSLECPKCGGLMKRVPDTLDVWFDSSVASWAILNYPRKKKVFRTWWPADLIVEGHDQVKGWFFGQLVSGMMAHGKPPYKRVLAHGLLCDNEGRGITKETSEEITPTTLTTQFGIDALRFYLLKNGIPGENLVFNEVGLAQAHRTIRILWNSLNFAASYMNMDEYDPFAKSYGKIKKNLLPEDSWLLSKIETLTNDVKKRMEELRFDRAAVLLEDFIVNELSRHYIRIIRRRMWEEGGSSGKEAAFFTLHETLSRLAVLSSPLIPYIAEEIYQVLDRRELSVHMLGWPEVQVARIAEGSEKSMSIVKQVVDVAIKTRQKHGQKLRWPVQKVIITSSNEEVTDAMDMFNDVFKTLVNTKELEVVPAGQEWEGQELEVIPNPNVIGKAYKQWESKVARMLRVLPAKDVKAKIDKGEYQLGIEGQNLKILPDMVAFKTKLPDGIVTEDFPEGQLFMDTAQTDELNSEGFAREIIRRIQDMRKDMELDIEEYISLSIVMSGPLLSLLDTHKDLEMIVDETRANQIEIVEEAEGEYIIEWEIEEEPVSIGVTALDIKKSVDEYARIPEIDRKLALGLVDAGITGGAMFTDAQREFILKFPGMTNAKFRKIKEYFEMPEEKRAEAEGQLCPICETELDPGSDTCQRCGISADGELGEIPEIEFIGEISEEEELADSLIEDEMFEDEEEEEEEESPPAPRKRKKAEEPEPEDEPEEDEPEEPEPETVVVEDESLPGEEEPEEMEAPELVEEMEPVEDELPEPEDIEEPVEEEPEEEPLVAEVEPATEQEDDFLTEDALVQRVLDTLDDTQRKRLEEEAKSKEAPQEEDDDDLEYDEDESFSFEEEPGEAPAQPDVEETPQEAGDEEFESYAEAVADIPVETPEIAEETIPARKDDIIGGEQDEEIAQLSESLNINPSMAKLLYNEGYHTIHDLQQIKEDDLRTIKGIGKITARNIVDTLSSEETQMCTLCNAIVPADAQACPRCGVRFAHEEDEEEQNEERRQSKLELLDKKLSKTPDDVNLLFSKAMVLQDAGKTNEAIKVLDTALGISPNDEKLITAKMTLVEGESIQITDEGEPVEDTHEVDEGAIPTPVGTEDPIELRESFTYLIPEERSTRSYNLMKKMINRGMLGFCITRTFPDKVKERFELGETPVLWLSNVSKEDAVRPKDLEKLSLVLEEFLNSEGGIVLLDGIEYLITNNNFITVLKLIQSLRDQVAINRSILLLSINPSTMETHQINLLKREVDVVIDQDS